MRADHSRPAAVPAEWGGPPPPSAVRFLRHPSARLAYPVHNLLLQLEVCLPDGPEFDFVFDLIAPRDGEWESIPIQSRL